MPTPFRRVSAEEGDGHFDSMHLCELPSYWRLDGTDLR